MGELVVSDESAGLPLGSVDPQQLTSRLLEALAIERVINVDDDHSIAEQQNLYDVVGALRAETIDPLLVVRLVAPNEPGESVASLDDAIDIVEERWEEVSPETRIELTQAALRAGDAQTNPARSREAEQDGAAQLALPDLVGEVEYVRLSFADWRERGFEMLSDQKRTLLLFDRSFEREGQSATAGDELIRSVLSRDDMSHVFAGLLTHMAEDADGERQISKEAEAYFENGPVIVVAKQRLAQGSFPEALRLVLFARELEIFRSTVVRGMNEARDEVVGLMTRLDRYVLLASMEAARQEGSYEADHLLRLAAATARKTMTRVSRVADFVEGSLPSLRNAAAVQLYFEGAPRPDGLHSLEWQERFDDAEHLAAHAIPIDIGDIFCISDVLGEGKSRGADRYYILLAQACDLGVRLNGKRSNDLTLLTLTEVRKAAIDTDTGRCREVKGNEADLGRLISGEDAEWRIRFANQTLVPALALDACVFNEDGRSVLSPELSVQGVLPESWVKRGERMQVEALQILNKFRPLAEVLATEGRVSSSLRAARGHVIASLLSVQARHSDGVTGSIDLNSSTIEYGVRRFARVTDAAARGFLAELSHHHARPDFDAHLFYEPA